MCDASCNTIYNQSQYHCINKQDYHQDFHPKVRVPNAFIPSEDFAHIGFVLGDKFCLFGSVISQYRSPTVYRMVYELSKFCKLFGSDGCLEVRVPFCFHDGITDAVDDIITTAGSRFERTFNMTFSSDGLLQILIELYQRFFCLSYFYEKFIHF